MALIRSEHVSGLLQRTLNHIDSRLVDHGIHVAFVMSRLMEVANQYSPKEIRDLSMLALLHDIGAYKTDEINHLLLFESDNIWDHSIYGYLFLRQFSPIQEWVPVILYHHLRYDLSNTVIPAHRPYLELAQMMHLADRLDIFLQKERQDNSFFLYLESVRDTRFSSKVIDLFYKADARYHLQDALRNGTISEAPISNPSFSEDELNIYLKLLTYMIDFRSQHTVTHTITTVYTSLQLAKRMGLSRETQRKIYYGATLHDLGKIGIPISILEYPGKLSFSDMEIMKSHVALTEKILNDNVDPETAQIALRHHERLDGTGYHRGLKGSELSLSQRIVSVADVVSALTEPRCYKESFPKDKTLRILKEEAEKGKLDFQVVAMVMEHYDAIMEYVTEQCTPLIQTYQSIHTNYNTLLQNRARHPNHPILE